MNERTWIFFDKSKWPARGEWDSEPDKVQWVDDATRMPCLALRAHGHWCGYVGVPEGHSAYQRGYDEVDVSGHGGLTFASLCDPRGHSDTEPRICHIAAPGEPEHLWWFGFDCAHSGDLRPATDYVTHRINQQYPMAAGYESYKDIQYVKHECAELAKQLSGDTTCEEVGHDA